MRTETDTVKQVIRGREVVIDVFEYNSFEQFGQERQIRYRSEVLEFIRVEVGSLLKSGRTTADLNKVWERCRKKSKGRC